MSKAKQPGLDGRHRNNDGETRAKRSDTQVGTLRDTYGEGFARGTRSDCTLGTLLEKTGAGSLDQYLRKNGQ